MDIWYLETSAINQLMSQLSAADALATRKLQLAKERDWRLSPVTLWEIFQTSDEGRREQIVHFCQHLFSREILPSPPELIVSYIEQGMPRVEQWRELISRTVLASVWRELADDSNRCFQLDYRELRRKVKAIQSFVKDIHNIVKNNDVLIRIDDASLNTDLTLSRLVNRLPFLRDAPPISPEDRLLYKLSIYYILVILCAGIDLDNTIIEEFWRKNGIGKTTDRIIYVVEELPTLVHRGPFLTMACMTAAQAKGKHSRGLFSDSLHAIYIPYVDRLFTSDAHFGEFRDAIPEPTLRGRIFHLDEVEVIRRPDILA